MASVSSRVVILRDGMLWEVNLGAGQVVIQPLSLMFEGPTCTGSPYVGLPADMAGPQNTSVPHDGATVAGEPVYRISGPFVTVTESSSLFNGTCAAMAPYTDRFARAVEVFTTAPGPFTAPFMIH